jgi:hypothetical protein
VIGRPEPISHGHALEPFRSGTPSLDRRLKHRALHNEREQASRTCVVCAEIWAIA